MANRLEPPVLERFSERFGDRVKFNEPLAPYVAYRIGGPADILVSPRDGSDLQWLADACKQYALDLTVIGTGTNLLVTDRGIRGVVVSFLHAFQEIHYLGQSAQGKHLVRCGAGVKKPDLLEWAIERGFAGLEFSAGVPGTLGGGIYMNAGTKYGCYADRLVELETFGLDRGLRTLPRTDLYFGYREQTAVGNDLVVSMVFALEKGDPVRLRAEVERIIAERAEKQPLHLPSCGSTFKNPAEGLSAGRLIERAGLKGLRVGGAEVSMKHANFLLNTGNAKAQDILDLIAIIKRTVAEKFQVELECEVIIMGEQPIEHSNQIPDPSRIP